MDKRGLKKHLDTIELLYQINEINHINVEHGTNYDINDYVMLMSKNQLKKYFSSAPLAHMLKWNNAIRKKFVSWSICNDHNAKMEGLASISTACSCNENCKALSSVEGSICEKCYAQAQLTYQPTTRNKYTQCYLFYTHVELTTGDIPIINRRWFRFEAFGDLENGRQFKNYTTIARVNKHCDFTLWTKNPQIIARALEDIGLYPISKPENMYIIVSSLFINEALSLKTLELCGYDKFVDAVFTVYDKEYAKKHDIIINCGARSCIGCLRCYTLKHGTIVFINELLK